MKKASTIIAVAVIVVALVVIVRTVIGAAVYNDDSGVVDVTARGFVPNNLDAVASSTIVTVKVGTSNITVLALSTSTEKASVDDMTAPKAIEKPPDAYPARLIISSLGIDANVQTTGITKRGSIGTPNNFTDVAWYVYGPVPGRSGTAIIDGHVDNGLGLSGVFKNLAELKVGDDVEVVTNGGESIHFIVSDVSSYDYKDVPASAIFAASGPSRIKLISCEGDWVNADKTYNKRIIITADLR